MCERFDAEQTPVIARRYDESFNQPQKIRIVPKNVQLDAIDRAILNALQADGRLSNVELASQVHLSPSACLRRVKQL